MFKGLSSCGGVGACCSWSSGVHVFISSVSLLLLAFPKFSYNLLSLLLDHLISVSSFFQRNSAKQTTRAEDVQCGH